MSHTPGPWFYRKCSASLEHDQTILAGLPSDGTNKVIADVCERGRHKEEGEANARLIAAAPELLAACKGLLERYRIMVAADGIEAMEAARVIAKVEAKS